LFIHWGVYSVLGDGEWVMNNRKMSIASMNRWPLSSNPTEFDAAQWVSLAKAAGMKYITSPVASRWLRMFATKQNQWNIVDATPYKKDPLKSLADECRRKA